MAQFPGRRSQALYLVRAHKHSEAEQLLLKALKKYENHIDILGVLGVVYKSWDPPRVTDAREKFGRAAQLKSKKEEMYVHWARMEIDQSEWTKAANAAEKGIKVLPESQVLLYLAGYAKTRLGKEFIRAVQREKAEKQFIEALALLERALTIKMTTGSRNIMSDIYRAIVIANEGLYRHQDLINYLKKWKDYNPDDANYQFEIDRLSAKFNLS